jgi:hypothetical protein
VLELGQLAAKPAHTLGDAFSGKEQQFRSAILLSAGVIPANLCFANANSTLPAIALLLHSPPHPEDLYGNHWLADEDVHDHG